jgi:hypothetical protein
VFGRENTADEKKKYLQEDRRSRAERRNQAGRRTWADTLPSRTVAVLADHMEAAAAAAA